MEKLKKTCLLSLKELEEGDMLTVWGVSGKQKKTYHFLILKNGGDLKVRCVFPVESSLFGRRFVLTDDMHEGKPLLADLDRSIAYTAIIKEVQGVEVKQSDFLDRTVASPVILQIRKLCEDFAGEIKKAWTDME